MTPAIGTVRRFRTNPVTCIREWFWTLNTAPPEHAAAMVGPCSRVVAAVVGVVAGAVPFGPPAWLGPQNASGATASDARADSPSGASPDTPTGAVPLASPGASPGPYIVAQTAYTPGRAIQPSAVWGTLLPTPPAVRLAPPPPLPPVLHPAPLPSSWPLPAEVLVPLPHVGPVPTEGPDSRQVVPEPGTVWLVAGGLGVLAWWRRG